MSDFAPSEGVAGVRLGEFTLDSVLGEGGGGTVYAARWGHREVALKVLKAELLVDPSERRRFLEEAHLLAEINHHGVVRIIGFGELPDGRPYLAMERLQGESLAERLRRQGAMSLATALPLFHQLAEAVQTLHARGLIHRDIKPENVFLVKGDQYAVLLDFGIAKPLDAPDSTVTRQGGVRGTPAYMAPERFFGSAATEQTDIYELGVVLYGMLTGRLPWKATDDPITRLNPQRPSEQGVVLPGFLEEVLLRVLSTRAENRPATVRAFATQVAQAMHCQTQPGGRRTADMPTPDQTTGPRLVTPAHSSPIGADLASAPTLAMAATPTPPELGSPGGQLPTTLDLNHPMTQAIGPESTVPDGSRPLGTPLPDPTSTGQVITGRRDASEPRAPLPQLPAPAAPRRRGLWLIGIGALALVALAVTIGYLLGRQRGLVPERLPKKPQQAGRQNAVDGALTGPAANEQPGSMARLLPFDRLAWSCHPQDTQFLLRINFKAFRKSQLYQAMAQTFSTTSKSTLVGTIKAACGIDLVATLDWVSVGAYGTDQDFDFDALLQGQWSRDKVEACLRTFGDKAEIKRKGRVTRVQYGKQFIYLAWPEERTLLVSSRSSANEDWFQARVLHKEPAHRNARLHGEFEAVDPHKTLWLVTTSPSWLMGDLLSSLRGAKGGWLVANLTERIAVEASAGFDSEKAAFRARATLQLQIKTLKVNPLASFLMQGLEAKHRGRRVHVAFQVGTLGTVAFGKAIATSLLKMDWRFLKDTKK